MTAAEVLEYARAAGRAGRGWMDFTADDALGDYCSENVETFDTVAIQAAFDEGRREWKISGGWLVRFTTAPSDYDGFQTETAEECGEYKGRQLRKVLIDPRYLTWHESRYGSGLHPTWSEDPRAADRAIAERIARDRVEREEHERRRAAGLAWVLAADDVELEQALEADDLTRDRGIDYRDVRDEQKRRKLARNEAARATEWARCRALLPDGATLLDDGVPARRGQWGNIPGRDPDIHHAISVEAYAYQGAPDPEVVIVRDAGGRQVGSLANVVRDIAEGRLRVAAAGDVIPPRAVAERVGRSRWRSIKRLEVEGRVVWASTPLFSSEVLALDEHGKKVRGKRLHDAVTFAYWKAT